MNHAIIVAGGVGSRMGLNIPKQYVLVNEIPIFLYSFRKFANHPLVDSIVMVLAEEWEPFAKEWIDKEGMTKQVFFAHSGISRQHSVLNGLKALSAIADDEDLVLVHDAVRPLFPLSNIDDGIEACHEYDAALPVISVKDATYQSHDGQLMSAILPRQELFSGQSPECFRYGKYYRVHEALSDEMIGSIRGSSELAFRTGMKVKLIPGTERNFKLTTIEDLNAFELTLKSEL